MGQNDHGDNSPDAGNTNSPQLPSQHLVGDSQPNYPSLIGSLKPMNPPPLQLQPSKNSAKSWLIGCSVAAGVVIFLCTLTSFALFLAVYNPIEREVDARATIENFCLEIQRQDYALVYNNYLSLAAKGRVGTADQFVNQLATLDKSEGFVTSCPIDLDTLRAAAAHSDGERMDVQVYVSRGNNISNDPNWSDKSVTITLVFENSAWKVDDAEPTHILF